MCCECENTENPFQLLDKTFDKYSNKSGLIAVLQEAQEIYGYLSSELLLHIASKMRIKPAKVLGVATFYAQFRLKPVGKNMILLCQGTACHVNGSADIEEAICGELLIKEGETTPDGLVTLNNVACLGCCSLSPVMMINGETYGSLTPDKARNIIREIMKPDPNVKEEKAI
jgi:NADH-quinone oxidoreductase subunit E